MTDGPSVPPRIRPGWVWGIFLFYLVTAGWAILARVLIWVDLYQAPEEQLAILRNQSIGSVFFGFALAGLSLTAATMLWLLRRLAFTLFVAATALTICSTVWQMFSGGPLDQLMSQSTLILIVMLFSLLGGWAISLAICMYAWKLRQQGVLQ